MTSNPLHDVVIVGVGNTEQGKRLEGHTSFSIAVEAVRLALADAGLSPGDVDGSVGAMGGDLEYQLRIGPAWRGMGPANAGGVVTAALAIAAGMATTVVVADGGAAVHTDRAKTAPWTRPENEFVIPWGMFTAAEFALIARHHMHTFDTPVEALATVAATIRNNGSINPDAVMAGRGPYSAADVLASPMIADPFHRLDCAIDSEGGAALVLTTAERARDLPGVAVRLLGGSGDRFGPAYKHPPAWSFGSRTDLVNGWIGRRAADQAFAMAGLGRNDVDVAELYDPFSFEIIRQLEAFRFCAEGEAAGFVLDGHISPDATLPVTTDGGVLSFSHPGASAQMLQRVIRAAQQLRGTCATNQVSGAEVAFVSNGGAGALFSDVLLLGADHVVAVGKSRSVGGSRANADASSSTPANALSSVPSPPATSATAATSGSEVGEAVISDPQAWLAPQPQGIAPTMTNPVSAPLWEGAAAGELRYQFCEACEIPVMDPQPACPQCLVQSLAWRISEGLGEIESYSVVWRAPLPRLEVPYAPAIVRLDEGYSMLTNITGCQVGDLAVGKRVTVHFAEIDGATLPYFAPSEHTDQQR